MFPNIEIPKALSLFPRIYFPSSQNNEPSLLLLLYCAFSVE